MGLIMFCSENPHFPLAVAVAVAVADKNYGTKRPAEEKNRIKTG